MSRTPKTLQDIIDETRAFHLRLLSHLKHCEQQCPNEREKMLLNFIIEQQDWLSSSLIGLNNIKAQDAFGTWFYEYSDAYSVLHVAPEEIAFDQMNHSDICEKIRQINLQLIDAFEEINRHTRAHKPKLAIAELLQHMHSNTKQLAQQTANTEGL